MISKNKFRRLVILTGFSGFLAQMLLLRELLIIYSGNELAIGIILGNWMAAEALGAFIGGKITPRVAEKKRLFSIITVLFSLFLIMGVYYSRTLRALMGISIGEVIGLNSIVVTSLMILLLPAMLHGALFPVSVGIYAETAPSNSSGGKTYIYETAGTLLGGILWVFVFIQFLNSFQAAALVGILNLLGICLVFGWSDTLSVSKHTVLVKAPAVILILSVLPVGSFLHTRSLKTQWKDQNLLEYKNSPYGNIAVTESGGQYIFFLDGVSHLMTPVPDAEFIEEFVQIPMLFHNNPQKVLFIGGGAGGMIEETLKHRSVERVEYAELDPMLIHTIREYSTSIVENEFDDPRLRISSSDGRLFLRKEYNKYDIVFSLLSEPSELQSNRFYTEEYFNLVRSRLNEDGFFVLRIPGSMTFLNRELRDLNSSVFSTLGRVFPFKRVFPGEGYHIILASDSPDITSHTDERIMERLDEGGFIGEMDIPRNILQKLHPGWGRWFYDFVAPGTEKINADFRPAAMFYSIMRWNSIYSPEYLSLFRFMDEVNENRLIMLLLAVAFLIPLAVFLFKIRLPGNGSIVAAGSTGFTGMFLDLAIIFSFQAVYGYVFSWLGVLIAFYMAGAGAGAYFSVKYIRNHKGILHKLFFLETGLILFLLILPLLISSLNTLAWFRGDLLLKAVFPSASFIAGLLTGSEFPLFNRIRVEVGEDESGAAGGIYAADLLGGWSGGLIGGIFLLPVLGLKKSCYAIAIIKLMSLLLLVAGYYSKKRLKNIEEEMLIPEKTGGNIYKRW